MAPTIRSDVDPATGEIRQPLSAEDVAIERFLEFLRAQGDQS